MSRARLPYVLQARLDTPLPSAWFDVLQAGSLDHARALRERARRVWKGDPFRIVRIDRAGRRRVVDAGSQVPA